MRRIRNKDETTVSRAGHPTIATIAAHIGVSRSTVTHVLNGRAKEQRIRPETQKRVLDVAQELGYRANASARAVRAGRFGSVALIQSQLGQYLPSELLCGLTAAIAAEDLHLVLTEVANVDATGDSYVEHTMRQLSVDGVLMNRHGDSTPPFMERIHALRIPAIFLNAKLDFDCIYPDDLMGGRLASEFLLRLGHERIAYVETELRCKPHYSERDRRTGYEQAMTSAGLTPQVHQIPVGWRIPEDPGADRRVDAAIGMLAGPERPTAVIAYEQAEAMAVVHAAHQLQLRIPNDLSLIRFHNCIDDRSFIPIHTVSNSMRGVGEGAVKLLLEKIANPDQPLPAQIVPEALIEGATCMGPVRFAPKR
jgi:LacI family transcriptional regulator